MRLDSRGRFDWKDRVVKGELSLNHGSTPPVKPMRKYTFIIII